MKINYFLILILFYFKVVTLGFEFNNGNTEYVDTDDPQRHKNLQFRIKRRGGFGGGGRGISMGRGASVGRSGSVASGSGRTSGGARTGGVLFVGSSGHGSGDGNNSTTYENQHDEKEDVIMGIIFILFGILSIAGCCIEVYEKRFKSSQNNTLQPVVEPPPRYYSNGSNQAMKYTSTSPTINDDKSPPYYKKEMVT